MVSTGNGPGDRTTDIEYHLLLQDIYVQLQSVGLPPTLSQLQLAPQLCHMLLGFSRFGCNLRHCLGALLPGPI